MKNNVIVAISVVVFAIVIFGEFSVYASDFYRYDADAERVDGGLQYSVSSSGADTYNVVVLDSGAFTPLSSLYIYIDDSYDRYFEDYYAVSKIYRLDQRYCADQLIKNLENRGFSAVTVHGAGELEDLMRSDADSAVSKGLFVFSYALPEGIYSGSSDDLIFKWMSSGGSLYWTGSEIGKCFSTGSGLVFVEGNQDLFFGTECVNTGETDQAFSRIEADGLTEALSLKNNSVRFGLDISGIPDSYALGYSESGYSSIAFVGFGEGEVCVIAGDYRYYLSDDAAQLISAGVCRSTEVVGLSDGSVKRTVVRGTVDVPESGPGVLVYIYIGGYYTVFGESFHGI